MDYGNDEFNEISCIKTITEFELLTRQVELIRQNSSFQEFTKSKQDLFDGELYSLVKICLYFTTVLISLFGNLMIILVISCNKTMRKKGNYFILNLAICDLAILFSCMWIQPILIKYDNIWLMGEMYCKINSFLQMVSIIAFVLTLSLISCDRYIGIVHPLKSKTITSRVSYCLIIIGVWIVSILISIPMYKYRTYTERKWSDYIERNCDDSGWPINFIKDENGCILKTIKRFKRIYYTSVIVVFFFLPMILITITYSIMIKKLWPSNDYVAERRNRHRTGLDPISKRKKKATMMLLFLIIIFFICWYITKN